MVWPDGKEWYFVERESGIYSVRPLEGLGFPIDSFKIQVSTPDTRINIKRADRKILLNRVYLFSSRFL